MKKLMLGDNFCSSSPQSKVLGAGIKLFQRPWSIDRDATYGHSGIIKNSQGDTFEALWRVKSQNIFKNYIGQRVIIARPVKTISGNPITLEAKEKALAAIIKEFEGDYYPGWRLVLHILPVLAKNIHFAGKGVCSEIVANFLALIESWWSKAIWGVNPDTLADEFRDSWRFEIIFQGIITPGIEKEFIED